MVIIATETHGHSDAQTEPDIFLCLAVQKTFRHMLKYKRYSSAYCFFDIYEQLNLSFFPYFFEEFI
jgi:hypothetical protein